MNPDELEALLLTATKDADAVEHEYAVTAQDRAAHATQRDRIDRLARQLLGADRWERALYGDPSQKEHA